MGFRPGPAANAAGSLPLRALLNSINPARERQLPPPAGPVPAYGRHFLLPHNRQSAEPCACRCPWVFEHVPRCPTACPPVRCFMCLYPVIRFMPSRPTIDDDTAGRVANIVSREYGIDRADEMPFNRQLQLALDALDTADDQHTHAEPVAALPTRNRLQRLLRTPDPGR